MKCHLAQKPLGHFMFLRSQFPLCVFLCYDQSITSLKVVSVLGRTQDLHLFCVFTSRNKLLWSLLLLVHTHTHIDSLTPLIHSSLTYLWDVGTEPLGLKIVNFSNHKIIIGLFSNRTAEYVVVEDTCNPTTVQK